ncbi:MAG: multicopper oxidase domain-containing protein [Rhodothermales bacterium]|nr:multicopper oxidase domain-containing protein [Rhodothermales bacterium]
MRLVFYMAVLVCFASQSSSAQDLSPRIIANQFEANLPRVEPNDNRVPAGSLQGDSLQLDLDIVWADWRIETDDDVGIRVTAIAERGGVPQIPAPLIRVRANTSLRISVHNTLSESSITVFGLQSRPSQHLDSLVVQPGAIEVVDFEAGSPGTYLYRVRLDDESLRRPGERAQLAGAFIIDPIGDMVQDRVMVMNIFSAPIDSSRYGRRFVEALTINGLSWPHTERMTPAVGDTLRWRIINASGRNHPMHLHGFFYDVMSIGSMLEDEIYRPEDRRHVVTEFLRRQTTMMMEWVPTRPGNWLFHCHLSFHVSPDVRLPHGPGSAGQQKSHMAGLVTGIEVQPGPTDLIERGEPRYVNLNVGEFPDDSLHQYQFSLDSSNTTRAGYSVPGPVLVFRQYEPTFVTIRNHMTIPTGVHWHGLELDSWADGVPGWSASDGKVSPVIEPGNEFTYKLSLMRPGTFIYHSHLDDIHQLTGGLYGPLIVLGEDEEYSPEKEHIAIVGWNTPDPQSPKDLDLNGQSDQPTRYAYIGETYRIRVINIAPAGNVTTRMTKDDLPVLLTPVAKDGAELPANQRISVDVSPRMGVGETADFVFTPTESGTYELLIGPGWYKWKQDWIVTEKPKEE